MNLSVVSILYKVTNHKSQITSHKSQIVRQHFLAFVVGGELRSEELVDDNTQKCVGGHGEDHGEDAAKVAGHKDDNENL